MKIRERNAKIGLIAMAAPSLIAFLCFATTDGLARSLERRGSALDGKLAAPTMEDGADYFAKSESESLEVQQKVDEIRLKTIASIASLLAEIPKGPRRFELLLRMGELYVERHDYLREVEIDSFSKAWDRWEKDGKKGSEPRVSYAGSKGELTKAANTFRKLVTEFPKHPRTDAALYVLAKTLSRLGNENCVLYYKQLIKTFPDSPLRPDAYLSLGEFYFDRHQITLAMENYKAAMNYKENRVYPYAVYKLGWAYYNAPSKNQDESHKNLSKAVSAFKLVVKLSDKEGARVGKLNLREEAIKDLVMVWAETEDVDTAWDYFQNIGEKNSFYIMLERLGNIYAENGQNEKAITVYARLMNETPNRSVNPDLLAKVIELREHSNRHPGAVVKDLELMVRLYYGKTSWAQANAKDKEVVEKANKTVEFNLRRYGTLFHSRGDKAHNQELLEAAAQIYALYLNAYPKNDNAYEIRFYLAQILYDQKKFEQASMHYMIVAKARPKDGKYLKTAALNSVAALNDLVNQTKFQPVPKWGHVPQPLAVPREKAKLIETIDEYVKLLPNETAGQPMRFTAAQAYFDYGHYSEAIKRCETIINQLPQTKQADSSVKLIVGYYAEQQDWSKAMTWTGRFSKSKVLMSKPEIKTYVTDMHRVSIFNAALAFEKSKRYESAALVFLNFQQTFPDDKNADRALYNASVNYSRVGKIEKSLALQQKMLEQYPKSTLKSTVLVNLAETNEALGYFDVAARSYREFGRSFPQDPRSPGALFNAAILFKGLNDTASAMTLFDEFARRYPNNKLAGDALLELAQLQEKGGRNAEAMNTYALYGSRYSSAGTDQEMFAEAKIAELSAAAGRPADAQKKIDKLRLRLAKTQTPAFEARRIVASYMFKNLDGRFSEFKASRINNPARIEADVKRKQSQLESLASSYERVIEVGNAEFTVASLYRLGEMHENFAEELFKAPSPRGVSQAALDAFRSSLEKVAFPLKEESQKFFEAAYNQAKDVNTFTVWTQRIHKKMVEVQPDKYKEVNEQSAQPSYLSHTVLVGKEVADLSDTLTEE